MHLYYVYLLRPCDGFRQVAAMQSHAKALLVKCTQLRCKNPGSHMPGVCLRRYRYACNCRRYTSKVELKSTFQAYHRCNWCKSAKIGGKCSNNNALGTVAGTPQAYRRHICEPGLRQLHAYDTCCPRPFWTWKITILFTMIVLYPTKFNMLLLNYSSDKWFVTIIV